MSEDNTNPKIEIRHSETLLSIVNTLQWVIIALILAFVFRSFIMEAFRIPTGSMAETLRGAHHHLRCRQCGYLYDLGTDNSGTGGPQCPSCRYIVKQSIQKPSSNGDRIFVLKCLYEFCEPKRWDVTVFKYPVDPTTNYIKRLVGLPGESIQITDGDIFINGQIARKPPKVQSEMWMPIYDNDYQPLAAYGKGPGDFDWVMPFVNQEGSCWDINLSGTTYFTLNSPPDQPSTILYDSSMNDDFRAYYAYNYTTEYRILPLCTDLKVRFYTHIQNHSSEGMIGAQLRKYDILYKASVAFDGRMSIKKESGDGTELLASRDIDIIPGSADLFEFALVDRQLILEYAGEKLKFDLGIFPEDLNYMENTSGSLVGITGAGNLKLSHIAIYRDTYYLGDTDVIRPRAGKPFELAEDEFFACGDNSPASFDSRLWGTEGKGNNGKTYRMGIVPRDYLLGKAFFLYWGDAFRPFGNMLPIIPNFTQMKVIYGGSEEQF